jgi:hypothetical protein
MDMGDGGSKDVCVTKSEPHPKKDCHRIKAMEHSAATQLLPPLGCLDILLQALASMLGGRGR